LPDTPSQSLTEQALARLRKLGEGNGLAPEAFKLVENQESIIAVEAQVRLTPLFTTQAKAYPGPIKGKKIQALPDFAALQEDVGRRKQQFQSSGVWSEEALQELKKSPGYGWGHDGGKIVLHEQNVTLAANEKCPACRASGLLTCPQCQGRMTVICSYCQGRGQENCYNCFGKGEDPVNPGHQCPVCRGTRFATCRYCRATGQLPCPTCQGKGGTPCTSCQGTGSVTQQVNIEAGAEIHFQIARGSNLPSGLLRSLDRLGMANLAKGHADIEIIDPPKDAPAESNNIVFLRAKIPYADIKLRLKDKLVFAASFGKKGLLSGLPAFLDDSLRPWRERLVRAALGAEPLEKALEARAMREALGLVFANKTEANDLRRIYPLGLSPGTAKEIMNNVGMALRRLTLRARALVAATSLAISAALFAGLFFSPPGKQMAQTFAPGTLLFIQVALPILAMSLSAYAFAHAIRWVLQRRFPKHAIRLGQGLGKLGYGTLAGIFLLYALAFALTKFI